MYKTITLNPIFYASDFVSGVDRVIPILNQVGGGFQPPITEIGEDKLRPQKKRIPPMLSEYRSPRSCERFLECVLYTPHHESLLASIIQ